MKCVSGSSGWGDWRVGLVPIAPYQGLCLLLAFFLAASQPATTRSPPSGAKSIQLIAGIWWYICYFTHGCPESFAAATLGSSLGVCGSDLVEFLDERPVKESVERFIEG